MQRIPFSSWFEIYQSKKKNRRTWLINPAFAMKNETGIVIAMADKEEEEEEEEGNGAGEEGEGRK
jgi:hypothetical protein